MDSEISFFLTLIKYERQSSQVTFCERIKLKYQLVEFLLAFLSLPLKSGDLRWSQAMVEYLFYLEKKDFRGLVENLILHFLMQL